MSQSQNVPGGPTRRGANVYFAASGIAQVSALLRYVILARMLGPEQLGLAATLVLTSAFFDLISETGSDRFLIQDRDGDTIEAQRLVHLVYILRGVTTAAALAACAWPIATILYKAPRLAPALMILGVSRLIYGFLHLDLRRFQRHLDFRAEAACMIAGETAGLLATGVAAYLTHHFTAILYGLIIRALVMVIVSHLQAERPYAVGYSKQHAGRLSRFAGPLMLNGLLLFFATQGDRALVGNQIGFVALGRYSAVLLLIYYPTAMLQRYTQAMYLPLLARARDDPMERQRVGAIMGGQVLLLALAISTGFALVGPFGIKFLYGARFSESPLIVGLIGILQTSRFLLVFPTVVALSVGRSFATLIVNVVRLAAYPFALVGGVILGGLPGVVVGFVFGELLAHMTGLGLLNRGFDRQIFSGFERIAYFVLVSSATLGWIWTFMNGSVAAGGGLLLVSVPLLAWIIHRERPAIDETVAMVRRLSRGLSARMARA